MNCKNVEELLPIYAGQDLEERQTMLVAAHLRVCTECAGSAREYGEATQLLQMFEPPQFGEATYAALRKRVLLEIDRESSKPSRLEFLVGLISRPSQARTTWAVATAVLLAVCALASYLMSNRMNGVRMEQASAGYQALHPTATASVPPAATGGSTNSQLNVTSQNGTGYLPPEPAGPSRRSLNLTAEALRHPPLAGRAPVVAVRSNRYSRGEPKESPRITSATADKPMRLELQTNDPNIRIIWFSHPSNNVASPSESSKGI